MNGLILVCLFSVLMALVAFVLLCHGWYGTNCIKTIRRLKLFSRVIAETEPLSGDLARYGYRLSDEDPRYGKLWIADPDDMVQMSNFRGYGLIWEMRSRFEKYLCILEVVCPSTGQHHFLKVPRWRVYNAHSAVAWTFGLNTVSYRPTIEA